MVSVDGFVNDEGEPSFEFKDTQKADELVNSDETMSAIDRAMGILNKKEMKIAELYFIDQMKYKEIAAQMELNLGTVKANINRIRVKLQNKLSKVYE